MTRWIFGACLGGLCALMAGLPLAWVAPIIFQQPGASYSGTIWQGQVTDLPGLPPLSLHMRPQTLLSGTPIRVYGAGEITLSGHVGPRHAKDVQISLPIRALSLKDTRLRGLAGGVNLSVETAEFDLSEGCTAVTGQARTNVLAANSATLQWTGPNLTGPLRCESGNVVADLSGQDNQAQDIHAELTIRPDGGYTANITVETSQAEAAAVLPIFGFSPTGSNQYQLNEQGRWR